MSTPEQPGYGGGQIPPPSAQPQYAQTPQPPYPQPPYTSAPSTSGRSALAWAAGVLGAVVLVGDLLLTVFFTVVPPLLGRSGSTAGWISTAGTATNVVQVLLGATAIVLGLVALRRASGRARLAAGAGIGFGAVVALITLGGLLGSAIEIALLHA